MKKKMVFSLHLTYRCSGCEARYIKQNTVFTYKSMCICKNCYEHIFPYSKDGYFDACTGVEFLAPVFRYKEKFRDIFLDFKFNSAYASGHLLGMAIYEQLKHRTEFDEYDFIVPVPVSKQRYNIRGYNQSELIGDYVSGALNIPVNKLLKRIKNSAPQSKVEHSKRASNVKNSFAATDLLNGENIILVDDVYTTGSTSCECARVLHEAGAGKVCVVVAAYNLPVFRSDADIF